MKLDFRKERTSRALTPICWIPVLNTATYRVNLIQCTALSEVISSLLTFRLDIRCFARVPTAKMFGYHLHLRTIATKVKEGMFEIYLVGGLQVTGTPVGSRTVCGRKL